MKKLISKLLVGIFSLGLCVNLSAEEWKSYKFKGTNTSDLSVPAKSSTHLSEDIIILAQGDKVEFVSFVGSHRQNSLLYIKVSLDDENKVNLKYTPGDTKFRQNFETIYGPCKVEISATMYRSESMAFICKITRAHESQGRNVTGYSLVLPESTDTNYNLVLESSTDLVSWTEDSLGSKDSSDRKRFYRLRAVKE
jgi:hypothetical protein